MSRTQKGQKGPGYEYWTARPGNRNGQTPGRFSKQQTHRAERRQGKVVVLAEQATEPHHWSEDICDGCPQCLCVKCGGWIVTSIEVEDFKCIDCGHRPEEAE